MIRRHIVGCTALVSPDIVRERRYRDLRYNGTICPGAGWPEYYCSHVAMLFHPVRVWLERYNTSILASCCTGRAARKENIVQPINKTFDSTLGYEFIGTWPGRIWRPSSDRALGGDQDWLRSLHVTWSRTLSRLPPFTQAARQSHQSRLPPLCALSLLIDRP